MNITLPDDEYLNSKLAEVQQSDKHVAVCTDKCTGNVVDLRM